MDQRQVYLIQSYHDNWQNYLDSIAGRATSPVWDLCVITASNVDQAQAYRCQLEQRIEAGLLPSSTGFLVIPDPDGKRVGSGGATLNVLLECYKSFLRNEKSHRNAFEGRRVLVIHSGGDCKRIPQYSAFGKLFSRVPRELPNGRPSTLFDELFISLSALAAIMNEGVLIVSGDVLFLFDSKQLDFRRQGVIGVTCKARASIGSNHGVYVVNPKNGRAKKFLHKASPAKLTAYGAVDESGHVNVDTGIVWLDPDVAKCLVSLVYSEDTEQEQAKVECLINDGVRLNLYGDFLFPLTEEATLEDYLKESTEGKDSTLLLEIRNELWRKLRGIPLYVQSVSPAEFVHFGTSREFRDLLVRQIDPFTAIGWSRRTLAYAANQNLTATLVNSCIESNAISNGMFLVEDSHLAASSIIGDGSIISNVVTTMSFQLRDNIVLHQIPICADDGDVKYVTQIYGVEDNPKDHSDYGTFCNISWTQWLKDVPEVVEEHIWSHVSNDERSLWNARLFPICNERDESLKLVLWLQDPKMATDQILGQWFSAERVSLEDCVSLANRVQIIKDQTMIEDVVRRKLFLKNIDDEKELSYFVNILGSDPVRIINNVVYLTKVIGKYNNPLFRMRGYRIVAELLKNWKLDSATEMMLTASSDNSIETNGPFSWSSLEDKAFAELSNLVQSHSVLLNKYNCDEFKFKQVRVSAACRADLAGGWSDTPPFSIEKGGTVLNCAIELDGRLPITTVARVLDEPKLVLISNDLNVRKEVEYTDYILDYDDPADPLALHKAALVLTGIIPRVPNRGISSVFGGYGKGLELSTKVNVPKGSGLGTSSILAGTIVICLNSMLGRILSEHELFDQVLVLEQMLTTGGGWQDQIGGLTDGIKFVKSQPGIPQLPIYEPVELSASVRERFDKQFVIVYTGLRRLAKRILRDIMGAYILRERNVVNSLFEIQEIALLMRNALREGDLALVGHLMKRHWEINKRMDPYSTNAIIDKIFEVCEPYVFGAKLCGAGGGGFMELILKDEITIDQLNKVLKNAFPSGQVSVWPSSVAYRALKCETSTV